MSVAAAWRVSMSHCNLDEPVLVESVNVPWHVTRYGYVGYVVTRTWMYVHLVYVCKTVFVACRSKHNAQEALAYMPQIPPVDNQVVAIKIVTPGNGTMVLRYTHAPRIYVLLLVRISELPLSRHILMSLV
jgi:hypothetical protein